MTRTIAIAAVIAAACGTKTGSAPDAPPPAPDAMQPPDAGPPDAPDLSDAAPPANLACLGHAPSQTAGDPLIATGKLFAVANYQVAALANVQVVLRRTSDDHELATATTAADGSFAISIASGGAAQDAYFFVDDGVHRPTYALPGAPLTGSENALIIVADDAELTRWYADAGDTWSASKRTLIAAVTDCQPKSIAASITASPAPAKLVYYDPNAQHWDPALAQSDNGFVLLTGANVTETITANAGTQSYPAHTFAAHAGAITLAVVPPTL
jgi:hypothetical protein